MSDRGKTYFKLDSESDSETENLINSDEDESNTALNISQNFQARIRPASLVLHNPNSVGTIRKSCLNENENISSANRNNFVSNSSITSNLILANMPQNSGSNMATAAAVPISEIKEYLEMIPIFKGESELLPLFIKEASKIIKHFYDATNEENPRNDFITSRIRAKIQGEAALYLANRTIATWDDLRVSLIAAYADKRDDATLTLELVKLEQGTDTPFDFFKKIQKLLNAQICYANLNYGENAGLNSHFQRVALKTLLNGLKDPLGSLMRTKDPQDLDTALNLLTNTYQKEIHLQKFNKPVINIKKPQLMTFPRQNNVGQNFLPPFVASPSNFNTNNFQNRTNNVQNFNRPQAAKRPANSGQNYTNQYPQYQRQNTQNNQVTPMSISTANTYRPPLKVRPQNFNANESFDVENENLEQLNFNESSDIDDNNQDEINYSTPYNNFLGETAPENLEIE